MSASAAGAAPRSSSAGPASRPDPGRSVDVAAAERAYIAGPAGEAPAGETPSKPDQLSVQEVNYEVDRNRKLHHTTEYELKNLFVRRGQDFDIDVVFNKAPKTEVLTLQLTVQGAKVSSINRGTIIRLPFSRSREETGEWGVRIGSIEGAKYSLVIICPADAIVGRYKVAILVADTADAEPKIFNQKDPIYVLFNAWCPQDSVYMSDDVEKNEYVLNENGYLFYGTSRRGQQYARPWVFGQFEDTVTEVIFDLLERHIRELARRDPVVVARKFTCLVNYAPVWGHSNTETGILVGNWSGNYEDGVNPGKWTGSTKIYETYAGSKGQPVKYGQCWVFSGVLNTAMRCLGIPVRSVTNFASAHDTDASMTIDSVYDSETLDEVEYLSSDSVWNFHVWNEAWMSRPDLIPGMGGWQVIDATPQETSEGVYQTGPASVTAIKQGLTYLNYDTKFCFAEVNADRINWVATKKGTGPPDMKIAYSEKNSVGKYISTKRLPTDGPVSRWAARADVTLEYKYTEGSEEERMAVERAVSFGTRPNVYRKEEHADDVEMAINLAERLDVGLDFEVKVNFNNKSSAERNIDLVINVHICFYTGVLARKLQTEKLSLKLAAGNSEHSVAKILAQNYAGKLVDQSCIKIYVFGKVKETMQQVVAQDAVILYPPELKTEVKISGHEVELLAEFDNPLPVPLTNCSISFEGARFVRQFTLYPSNVSAKGHFKQRMKFSPRQKGRKTLVVDFDCNEMANVIDTVDIEIP